MTTWLIFSNGCCVVYNTQKTRASETTWPGMYETSFFGLIWTCGIDIFEGYTLCVYTMDAIHTPPDSHHTAADLAKMVAEKAAAKAAKKAAAKAAKKRRQRQTALDAVTQDEAAARLRELRQMSAENTDALLRAEQRVRGKRDAEAAAQRKAEQAKMCAEGLARQLVRDKQNNVRAAKAKKDKADKADKQAKDALAEQDRAAKAARAEVERLKIETELQFARKQDLVACSPGLPDTSLSPEELRAIVARALESGDHDDFDVPMEQEDVRVTASNLGDSLTAFVKDVDRTLAEDNTFADLDETARPLYKTLAAHLRQLETFAAETAFACMKHIVEAGGGQVTEAQAAAARVAAQHILRPLDAAFDIEQAVQEGLRW
jgi:hypothetical protein